MAPADIISTFTFTPPGGDDDHAKMMRKLAESDFQVVSREMADFLDDEPIFVLDLGDGNLGAMDATVEEAENWTKLSKDIFGHDVDIGEGPKFFNLSHFFSELDQMAWADAVQTGRADKLRREGCHVVTSASSATAIFEQDPFLYRMAVEESWFGKRIVEL